MPSDELLKTEPACDADVEVVVAPSQTRLFTRRWLILLIFCSYSFTNAYQWIHLNIVFDVILFYYNASLPDNATQANLAIDWLSMIYMLSYIVMILPAAWLLGKKGLRVTSIIATLLNLAGAGIKCAAVSPDRYWLLFIGQMFCASAQAFILGIPAQLAATWFGVNELSTATALGVFGNQMGVAAGFLIPPLFVKTYDGDLNLIGQNLMYMFIAGAAVSAALFLLVLFVFQEQPPVPPSIGQLYQRGGSIVIHDEAYGGVTDYHPSKSYAQSLVELFSNINFVLLTVSYGLNTGSYYAISTLLNPIIVPEFKARSNVTLSYIEEQVGWAGFTMIVAGILGAVLAGIWLDKTKRYKSTTLGIYVLSAAGAGLLTAALPFLQMWLIFLTMFLMGFFMTGYLPVGFEFAAEITFPVSEGLSSGLLNASAQIFGIIATIATRPVLDTFGSLAGNLVFCSLLTLGIILTAFIKPDLRRQRANKSPEPDENPHKSFSNGHDSVSLTKKGSGDPATLNLLTSESA